MPKVKLAAAFPSGTIFRTTANHYTHAWRLTLASGAVLTGFSVSLQGADTAAQSKLNQFSGRWYLRAKLDPAQNHTLKSCGDKFVAVKLDVTASLPKSLLKIMGLE